MSDIYGTSALDAHFLETTTYSSRILRYIWKYRGAAQVAPGFIPPVAEES
jgi:hypothetical protein